MRIQRQDLYMKGLDDLIRKDNEGRVLGKILFDADGLIKYQHQLEKHLNIKDKSKYLVLKSTLNEFKNNRRLVKLIDKYMTVVDDEDEIQDGQLSGYLEDMREIGMTTDKHIEGLAGLRLIGKLQEQDLKSLGNEARAKVMNLEVLKDYAKRAEEKGMTPEHFIRRYELASNEDMKVVAYTAFMADEHGQNVPVTLITEDSHLRQTVGMLKHKDRHGYKEVMRRVHMPCI